MKNKKKIIKHFKKHFKYLILKLILKVIFLIFLFLIAIPMFLSIIDKNQKIQKIILKNHLSLKEHNIINKDNTKK